MSLLIAFSKKFPFRRTFTALSPKGPTNGKFNVRIYLSKLSDFTAKYPLTRGMLTYFFIWPISNLCQQTIIGRKEYDYLEALRFCVYGSCFVAPTLHAWLRMAANMWPQQNYSSAIAKAIVEQFTYTPFAMVCFFFIMTLLEGKTMGDASTEVRVKFIPTYQVGACVWPVLQTINHTLVPERNRVPFVGMCSLLWTCFLAYMKQLEAQKLAAERARKHSYAVLT